MKYDYELCDFKINLQRVYKLFYLDKKITCIAKNWQKIWDVETH